jgi:hypothetical protein
MHYQQTTAEQMKSQLHRSLGQEPGSELGGGCGEESGPGLYLMSKAREWQKEHGFTEASIQLVAPPVTSLALIFFIWK